MVHELKWYSLIVTVPDYDCVKSYDIYQYIFYCEIKNVNSKNLHCLYEWNEKETDFSSENTGK